MSGCTPPFRAVTTSKASRSPRSPSNVLGLRKSSQRCLDLRPWVRALTRWTAGKASATSLATCELIGQCRRVQAAAEGTCVQAEAGVSA